MTPVRGTPVMGEALMMGHTGWEKHDGQLREGHHECVKRTGALPEGEGSVME